MSSSGNDHLKSFVERVERLEEEKKATADDIRDVYAEAKANGYDTKTLRKIIALRKIDANERAEQEAILETYMHALGMLIDTPLGQAAIKSVTIRSGEARKIGDVARELVEG